MNNAEGFSLLVSRALDSMGFSEECVKIKRELFQKAFEGKQEDFNLQLILAGSKSEGTSNLLESDTDIMKCINSLICCEDVRTIDRKKYYEVFFLDKRQACSGYSLIEHASRGAVAQPSAKVRQVYERMVVRASYQNKRGRKSLSSSVFVTEAQRTFNKNLKVWKSGPAISFNIQSVILPELEIQLKMSYDHVFAIPLHSPNLLRQWHQRSRSCGWPSEELQERIVAMKGHVVPVGHKQSDMQDKEWRICFTGAEKLLVWSFNDTQLKLYVLLKIISKKLLKPLCSDVTSYIVKNLMFWMIEKMPSEEFQPQALGLLLILALKMIRLVIYFKILPNYMIMGRNLFQGKLEEPGREKVLDLISKLIDTGPTFLVEIPELTLFRYAVVTLYRNPSKAEKNRSRKVEMYKLLMFLVLNFPEEKLRYLFSARDGQMIPERMFATIEIIAGQHAGWSSLVDFIVFALENCPLLIEISANALTKWVFSGHLDRDILTNFLQSMTDLMS